MHKFNRLDRFLDLFRFRKKSIKDEEDPVEYKSLIENSLVGVYIIHEQRLRYVNKRFCEIFGYSKEELIDVIPINELIIEEDRAMVAENIRKRVAREVSSLEYDFRAQRKDGSMTWVAVLGNLAEYNKEPAIAGTIVDISKNKNLENQLKLNEELLEKRVELRTKQLEKANQDLESFTYSVSHDLRAPLRHLGGFLDLLKSAVDMDDEKVNNYIEKLDLSINRMSTLIEELLKFSRLGRAEMQMSEVNLQEIINVIIEESKPDFSSRNIKWEINSLPTIHADAALIKIVFENLISNAIKYTELKDEAIIEIGKKEVPNNHETCIYVKDNGAGFNMKYMGKLFGVFQRLHTNNEFKGVGIGLANVKQIIAKHNGSVSAESEVDKGATFYITLPK